MPVRPREINDQPTEARLREIIRYLLNQEVRRLLNANAALQSQVTQNTSDITANSTLITANATEIENNTRRYLMQPSLGLVTAAGFGSAGGGGGAVITDTSFASTQEWTISIEQQPIDVTLWARQSFTMDAQFDSFQFDSQPFNSGVEVKAVDVTTQATYTPNTKVFSIDWGSAKSGILYLLNFGNGSHYAVVAVAD